MASTRKPMIATTGKPIDPTEKKPTIFNTINALSATRPLTYQDLVEQNLPYEPFMVNRAFSLSEDAVLAASMMNQRPHLDKADQAAFYIHTLRPRRRFEKWPKSLEDPDSAVIAKYYGMSQREAKLSANLHTKEEVTVMRKVLEDGASPSRFR
jgi:hypothetical protein